MKTLTPQKVHFTYILLIGVKKYHVFKPTGFYSVEKT